MTVGKQRRVECLHFKDRAGPQNYVYFKFLDPEKNSFEFAQLVEERGGRERESKTYEYLRISLPGCHWKCQ